jgi:hypothetical protein
VEDRHVISLDVDAVSDQLQRQSRSIPHGFSDHDESLTSPTPGERAKDRGAGPSGKRIALDSRINRLEHAMGLELNVLDCSLAQDLVAVTAPPDLVGEE